MSDSRFTTDNTNLAAALAALHIPVKSIQPCTVLRHKDGNIVKTFDFEMVGAHFLGTRFICHDIDLAWRTREDFERKNAGHPLVAIRAALCARDWLERAWYGEISLPPRAESAFATDDETLASCWKAAGGRVTHVAERKWHFDRKPSRLFARDYTSWRYQDGNRIALMRLAIVFRRQLVEVVKQQPVCDYERHDFSDGDFNEKFIPSGLPAEQREALEEAYQNL